MADASLPAPGEPSDVLQLDDIDVRQVHMRVLKTDPRMPERAVRNVLDALMDYFEGRLSKAGAAGTTDAPDVDQLLHDAEHAESGAMMAAAMKDLDSARRLIEKAVRLRVAAAGGVSEDTVVAWVARAKCEKVHSYPADRVPCVTCDRSARHVLDDVLSPEARS